MIAGTWFQTVGVVGLGTIGASWAALFLARGLNVRCYDPWTDAEPRLTEFLRANWHVFAKDSGAPSLDQALRSLVFLHSTEEAALGAEFIQESASEQLELKRDLLASIESGAGAGAIIASSTSGLMPSLMQSGMTHPGRFVVGHPFNPPHLMPLVEVVAGTQTHEATVVRACGFYSAIGKRPIRIRKEVKGHVANRLQAALWREAIHLALEGVASVADIDAAVVSGPGARWAVMGPHLTFHLAGGQGGIGHFMTHLGPAFEEWWQDLGRPTLDPATRTVLEQGIAERHSQSADALSAERDAELLKLLRAITPIS